MPGAVGHRRAGLQDGPHRTEVRPGRRAGARLLRRCQIGGADADHRGAGAFGGPPDPVDVGMGWAAVVQDERASVQQPPDHEVPHHPAGGGVEEVAVVRAQVDAEPERLEQFDDYAAVAVHDALRHAGGPRGPQDPQRVVERDVGEDRPGPAVGQFGPPVPGRIRPPRPGRTGPGHVQAVDGDQMADRGQAVQDLRDVWAPVVLLPPVAVAVRCHQDRRPRLPQPGDDARRAEVGRADRPGGADGGRGQEGHHGLRDVRQITGDAVPGAHSHLAQGGGHARHFVGEPVPRGLHGLAGLGHGDECGTCVGGVSEALPREVQPCSGEPGRAGHRRVGEHLVVVADGVQAVVLPHRRPEGREIVGAPPPQCLVAGERQAALCLQPPQEACDVAGRRAHADASGSEAVRQPTASRKSIACGQSS
ncbi:hypothetical protein EES39_33480 [Streptomyces sp. ADI92-24]|nr:hypothetical protein EES39_33480 [Streptomyces sp. ADI92-24]